jgi:tRNA threonylcarbamoyladenosine modification (KEOPS) complex Cgi121 subunit
MLCLSCKSSGEKLAQVVADAKRLPCACMLLAPEAVRGRTSLEISFAFYLARRAFSEKRNISQKIQNEALLFLSCESNFASALRSAGATDAGDFVLVCEKSLPVAKVKTALSLTFAKKIALPGWGKKKGHYTEAELAIEKMALARARN